MIKASELTTTDLVREALNMSENGWKKEVWMNLDTKEVSFSDWMTNNSWNESESKDQICVGVIESIDLNDFEGFSTIGSEFVEIDDDQGEISPDFRMENFEPYYSEYSSVLKIDDEELLDRVSELLQEDEPYVYIISDVEKLLENIEHKQNGKLRKVEITGQDNIVEVYSDSDGYLWYKEDGKFNKLMSENFNVQLTHIEGWVYDISLLVNE